MVKQWAEKEVRNLKRICKSGIKAPEPYMLKNNIILMQFIGDEGLAAPRLKDATLKGDDYTHCYLEVLKMMRTLYQECRLVHGDLSEYNILYFKDQVWLIDVSQSVEHDHPLALEFLRRDVVNVNDYFKRHKVPILRTRYAFDFITELELKSPDFDTELLRFKELMEADEAKMTTTDIEKLDVDEQVFRQIFIPRTLAEMDVYELEELEEKKHLLDNLTRTSHEEAEDRLSEGLARSRGASM